VRSRTTRVLGADARRAGLIPHRGHRGRQGPRDGQSRSGAVALRAREPGAPGDGVRDPDPRQGRTPSRRLEQEAAGAAMSSRANAIRIGDVFHVRLRTQRCRPRRAAAATSRAHPGRVAGAAGVWGCRTKQKPKTFAHRLDQRSRPQGRAGRSRPQSGTPCRTPRRPTGFRAAQVGSGRDSRGRGDTSARVARAGCRGSRCRPGNVGLDPLMAGKRVAQAPANAS